MKLKEILSLETSYGQEFIIACQDRHGNVFEIGRKTRWENTTQDYLNWEVTKIHATSFGGQIVLRVEEPNK